MINFRTVCNLMTKNLKHYLRIHGIRKKMFINLLQKNKLIAVLLFKKLNSCIFN